MAAWDAFLLARWMGEPVPEWVLAHIEKSAEKLCKTPKGDSPRKIERHVMTALGLRTYGKGSTFSRYLDEITRWKVVRRCIELHEQKPGRLYEQIFMDVADEFEGKGFSISIRTIEKWFGELHEIVRET